MKVSVDTSIKDERFEMLWEHHQRQIDENKAVQRSLSTIRAQLKYLMKHVVPIEEVEKMEI
jgi:hypothetical protein